MKKKGGYWNPSSIRFYQNKKLFSLFCKKGLDFGGFLQSALSKQKLFFPFFCKKGAGLLKAFFSQVYAKQGFPLLKKGLDYWKLSADGLCKTGFSHFEKRGWLLEAFFRRFMQNRVFPF